jgi:DNA-binding CsgD family transcriptional regulator
MGRDAVGYEQERARLRTAVEAARAGAGMAIGLVGEAGAGKTQLCADLLDDLPDDVTPLTTVGHERESTIPFAGLFDLLSPLTDQISRLPVPQVAALQAALALGPAPIAPEPLAVRAAVRNLLVEQATPLLVVVDDWQWLDTSSAQVLAFLAHRVQDTSIGMIAAGRALGGLETIDQVALTGLDEQAVVELLAHRRGTPVTVEVAQQVHHLTGGSPLAIVELAGSLPEVLFHGVGAWPRPVPVHGRLRERYLAEIHDLGPPTQRALIVAASSSGNAGVIGAALATLGGSMDDLADAEKAGLVTVSPSTVAFRHPLLASVIYDAAPSDERRAAHRALATASPDPDRRVWHRARAHVGHDAELAADLATAGQRALGRGAVPEAARAFEHAVDLAGDAPAASAYRLAAAGAWHQAGRPGHALALLPTEPAAADPAELTLLRCDIEMWMRGPAVARDRAVKAAERTSDPNLAALLRLLAATMTTMAGDVRRAASLADAALQDLPEDGPLVALATAIGGFARILLGDWEAGRLQWLDTEPQLLAAALDGDLLAAHGLLSGLTMCGEADRAAAHAARIAGAARERGSLGLVAYPLAWLGDNHSRMGRLDAAEAALTESVQLCRDVPNPAQMTHSLSLLARVDAQRGRDADCRAHAEEALQVADRLGLGSIEAFAHHALGLLALGAGRWEDAQTHLDHVRDVMQYHGVADPCVIPWAPDLIEALVRGDRLDDADRVLEEFGAAVERAPTDWARAALARCHGLRAGEDGIDHLQQALGAFTAQRSMFEAARTRLAIGEQLRRARHRTDARSHLRAALATFERQRATTWADRAREEMRAAGGRTAAARTPVLAELTPQELRIVLRVAEGATNREVAADLYLSPKTVENYLSRVYAKLGVRSRTELSRLVDAPET